MAKKSAAYFHFTQTQLDNYIADPNSCVKCVPNKMHIGFPPWGLENFKDSLLAVITAKKVGQYDAETKGIVLDVRNIRLEGTVSLLRHENPELHLDIHASFYCFQPRVGAELRGVVKHISKKHVSVLIYNVFNVSIRLNGDFQRKLQVNKEISFRVKKFDLQNVLPYIEGELLTGDGDVDSGIGESSKFKAATKQKKSSNDSTSSDSESDDEKTFKNLVVKMESKAAPSQSSSSSSSDDSSDDEDNAKSVPAAAAIKQEVKKEARKPASSSSDDSSNEDDDNAKPGKQEVKKEPKKHQESSSSESDSEDDNAPPSTLGVLKKKEVAPPAPIQIKAVKHESEPSTASESSVSDDEEKAPVTEIKVKPPAPIQIKAVKHESESSSESESSATDDETKMPVNIMKKVTVTAPEIATKEKSVKNKKTDSTKMPAKATDVRSLEKIKVESPEKKAPPVMKTPLSVVRAIKFSSDTSGNESKVKDSPKKKPAQKPKSTSPVKTTTTTSNIDASGLDQIIRQKILEEHAQTLKRPSSDTSGSESAKKKKIKASASNAVQGAAIHSHIDELISAVAQGQLESTAIPVMTAKKKRQTKAPKPAAIAAPKIAHDDTDAHIKTLEAMNLPADILADLIKTYRAKVGAAPKETANAIPESPQPKKKATKKAAKLPPPERPTKHDQSSSDEEEESFGGAINLNSSIKNLLGQVYSSKVQTEAADQDKKAPKKKKVKRDASNISKTEGEADVSKFNVADLLSSTRMDSPAKAPKKKKSKKSQEE